MRLLNIRCDHCMEKKEGNFVYFQISRRMVNSVFESDEIVGQSDLCEDCYKKLTRGELYNYE